MIQTLLIVIGLVLGAALVFLLWLNWVWARLDHSSGPMAGFTLVPIDVGPPQADRSDDAARPAVRLRSGRA